MKTRMDKKSTEFWQIAMYMGKLGIVVPDFDEDRYLFKPPVLKGSSMTVKGRPVIVGNGIEYLTPSAEDIAEYHSIVYPDVTVLGIETAGQYSFVKVVEKGTNMVYWHIYINDIDMGKNYPTLDSAMIGAIEVEYEHGHGMAAYYYEKMLNLSKEPEVAYDPKQNFRLLTLIDEHRIEGIRDTYPWGPVLDIECIDRFQIVKSLHDGEHRILWHIYDDYRDAGISLPTLAYALAVCIDMKHGSHTGKNAWAYAKMLNLYERPDKE